MAASDSAPVVDVVPAPEVPEEVPAEEKAVKPQRGRKAKATNVKKAEAPKEKKVKEVKAKEPKAPKVPKVKAPKPPASHPTYLLMVVEAIAALKERTGSSQYAIAKYLEDKYKTGLPPNFKKMLNTQLRNLTKAGKLVKVKNSFKLSDELKKPPKAAKPASLPKATVKVAPKVKVVKKPAASRVKSNTTRVGATKTKVSGAKATKAAKPEVKATKAAKLKRPSKVGAAAPKKAAAKVSAPVRKTASAKKAVAAKKAPAVADTKKPVTGRKPPTVRNMSTPKKAPKSVKGASAKAAAKPKTAKAAGPPAKKAKNSRNKVRASVPEDALSEAVTATKITKAIAKEAVPLESIVGDEERCDSSLSSRSKCDVVAGLAGNSRSSAKKAAMAAVVGTSVKGKNPLAVWVSRRKISIAKSKVPKAPVRKSRLHAIEKRCVPLELSCKRRVGRRLDQFPVA